MSLNTYKVACRVGKERQIFHASDLSNYEDARKSVLEGVEGCTSAVVLVQPIVFEGDNEEKPLDKTLQPNHNSSIDTH